MSGRQAVHPPRVKPARLQGNAIQPEPLERLPNLIGKFSLPFRDKPSAAIIVAALILIAVWSATIYSVQSERVRREALDRLQAQELASVLSAHVTNVFGYADTYLQAARREYMKNRDFDDLRAFMDAAPPNPAIMSHVTVVNSDATPIFISTGDRLKPGVSVSDRDYFKFLHAADDDLVYISRPAWGRNSGLLTIRIARRIASPSGEFLGLVFTSVQAEKLTEPFQSLDLGTNSSIGLIGNDGAVRFWSTGDRILTDFDTDDWALWSALKHAPTGVVRQVGPDNQHIHDFAYGQMDSYPMIAIIGVTDGDGKLSTSSYAWTAVLVALLFTLVVVVLTTAIQRDFRMMRALQNEVSVRRSAEADAVHATEIKSAFLATMSHEIRTPINSISGLFELIEKAEVPERQKRQARAGQTAAADLFKQLTNVLDASRLEAKSLELNFQAEPLAPMIAELSELLDAAIENSGKAIEAVVQTDPDLPKTMRLDRRRVEQIILNLVDNAVKFTATGQVGLFVSMLKSGPEAYLCMAVRDTGPGISKADQKRLFTPFSQLDSAITRRSGGTGLGLSICKQLAELMGADIKITSEIGQGSCFSLILPVNSRDYST